MTLWVRSLVVGEIESCVKIEVEVEVVVVVKGVVESSIKGLIKYAVSLLERTQAVITSHQGTRATRPSSLDTCASTCGPSLVLASS
jgi:hypothetical protein